MRQERLEERIVRVLEETRSVAATANLLRLPPDRVQKVALMAFGRGRLDVRLSDY
jgi:hypothetical protein